MTVSRVDPPNGYASFGELMRAEGATTFARFMELALTHSEVGYYATEGRRVGGGDEADFITAPGNVPAFNRAVGRFVADLADRVLEAASAAGDYGRVAVIELGPGEGMLARDVLSLWEEERPDLKSRIRYRLVDLEAGLRVRQEEVLACIRSRGWRVEWSSPATDRVGTLRPDTGDDPAEESAGSSGSCRAVVFSNEFFDALPVHLLDVRSGKIREVWVFENQGSAGGLSWGLGDPTEKALDEVELLFGHRDPVRLQGATRDGFIEVRPSVGSHFRRLSGLMREGCVLTIDYGEPFSVGTYRRTVRGYFRHRYSEDMGDVLSRPGEQDLTADVDFTALCIQGERHGFQEVFHAGLADFLRTTGALDELEELRREGVRSLEADRRVGLLAALLDPHDIGGMFRVVLQVKEG